MKIGFEVHEQLATERKLCCDCPTNYRDTPPNTNVCLICTAMPGAKPMPPNSRTVDAVIDIALMLGCDIVVDRPIYIQRKHYDYPDLPAGYQHSSTPIGISGELAGVRVREVHLEEDPGAYDPVAGAVDFNRCGIPLVEIVTEPDMHSPEEARRFFRKLMLVLEYSGKVRPEPGTLRADTNISLEGGTRVEIKNINSTKGAYRAIKFEIMRQKALIKRGEIVSHETRAYLESQMITVPMRLKMQDFHNIYDPDIFPMVIEPSKVESIRAAMHEPPHMRERRLAREYGIEPSVAGVIVSEQKLADLFEAVAKKVNPRFTSLWFKDRLKKVLNYMKMRAAEVKFTPAQMVKLLQMIQSDEITPEQGELVLRELVKRPADPGKLVRRIGLERVGRAEIRSVVEKAIRTNPDAVRDFRAGRGEALNFLAGKIMELTRGRADPREVVKLLRARIKKQGK
ncbi:MAG: Asp-tRNA(Asn)/Glu-tRNA(Gln) amidotransferase subunit GatB [Candidatus Hadarchaeota archaeon]|nr:Asp-tRNA(Asn)/Glu-tRNA(Gln) amidotransferase subunit GatB [Candidatus Hadarchaeota archaeon]